MERAPFAFSPPGRALCRYRLSAAEAEASFGPAHYAEGGPRSLPAWGFVLPCGLLIEVQLDAEREQGLLHAELRELEHAVRHLQIEDRIVWRMDEDKQAFERALEEYHPVSWGRWTVARHTEAGDIEAVRRCLSPQDAQCQAQALKEEGHRALVEEEPRSRAHERRALLTQKLAAKRRAQEPTWEVWWTDEAGAQSLLQIASNEQEARSWQAKAATERGGQWQVRRRS